MKHLLIILITFTGLSAHAQTDTLKLHDIQQADTLLNYNNPKLDSLEQAFTKRSYGIKHEYAIALTAKAMKDDKEK